MTNTLSSRRRQSGDVRLSITTKRYRSLSTATTTIGYCSPPRPKRLVKDWRNIRMSTPRLPPPRGSSSTSSAYPTPSMERRVSRKPTGNKYGYKFAEISVFKSCLHLVYPWHSEDTILFQILLDRYAFAGLVFNKEDKLSNIIQAYIFKNLNSCIFIVQFFFL